MATTPEEAERKHAAEYEALAERAYEAMYNSRSPTACYSDLKDYFSQAIAAARRAGIDEEAARLMARLDHCKQVYRKQFSTF